MTALFAQATPETTKTFLEKLPDILKAVASNPLGYGALILIVVAILAAFLFGKAQQKARLTAFALVIVCGLIFCGFVVYTYTRPPSQDSDKSTNQPTVLPPNVSVTDCKVVGHVYNDDVVPASGLQNVKLAYRALGQTNGQLITVTTTGPDGTFRFNCTQINPEDFPIHLRATYQNHVVESEDTLFFGENTDVNLYISPRAISNHYRLNAQVLQISSGQLFKSNFAVMTNALKPGPVAPGNLLTIPKNMRIQKAKTGVVNINK